jgi:hypothetical protein
MVVVQVLTVGTVFVFRKKTAEQITQRKLTKKIKRVQRYPITHLIPI